MSNTIFVPKLKHQQLLDLVIAEDRKQKKKEFEENLRKLVENDTSESTLNYVCINQGR